MDDIGIFIYLGFMILYGVMKALKKKKNQRPPVTKQQQPQTGTGSPPSKGIDLEEILGELFGEGQKQHPRPPREPEETDRTLEQTYTREQELEDSYNRRRLFDGKAEEVEEIIERPVNRLKDEGKTSRYKTLNEAGKGSVKKMDDMVSLDERTKSNLEVVNLDEEETGSHGDLLKALHNKDEFKKAFILSEILQRKYE
jgi:hypothetical protein